MGGNNSINEASNTSNNAPEGNYEDFIFPKYDAPLTVAVVNRNREIGSRALFLAENRLTEDINSHRGIRGIVNKIWKGSIARSYYRQKYANQARHDIISSQSLLLDYDKREREQYNYNVCEAFVDQVDGAIDKDGGDERHSLLADNPDLHADIKNIVGRYASGEIPDIEVAKREFNNLVEKLSSDNTKEHLVTTNISDIIIEAKRRYDSLMTIAEATASKLKHDDAIAKVMAGFDVLYGKRQDTNIEAQYNKTDRLINKLQNSKVGCLATPETIALATGAAMSVAEFFGKRVTSTALAAIPGLGSAVFGGLEASANFESERMRAKMDLRYGRQYNEKDKHRQEILKTIHPHYGAEELAKDLERRVNELNSVKDNATVFQARQNSLLSAIARCKYYLELDKTKDPVLCYSSEVKAPTEQLHLIQRVVRAKNFLSANGVTDLEDRLSSESELMQKVIDEVKQDIGEINTAARKTKIRRILKRMGTGFLTGITIGLATQEIGALFSPKIQGILGNKNASSGAERVTVGKKLSDFLRRRFSSSEKAGATINQNNLTTSNLVKASDGTFDLMDGNRVVASGVDWNNQTGELTEESIAKLSEQGVAVKTDYLRRTVRENIAKTQTSNVSVKEYYDKVGDTLGKVKRVFWYNNDTKRPDLNEVRFHSYRDATTGKFGFVTDMEDSGSYYGNTTARFSELVRNGKIKLMISPTNSTQQSPIEVSGTLLPNGQLAFAPEANSVAASFFDSDGNFLGRFAEIAEDLGKDESGTTLISPLATIVGKGYNGTLPLMEAINETVERSINVPQYTFTTSTMNGTSLQLPTFFPFTVEGAMRESKHHENQLEVPTQVASRAYTEGYQEKSQEVFGERRGIVLKKDVSPVVLEGKKITLGEGVNWHHDQMRRIMGDKYADNIEKNVQNCPDFAKLDQDVKTVVTIPVHAPTEYDNIYKTLSLYANQEDVDPKSFMVFLNLNWRETENGTPDEVRANIQKTYDEINRFRRDFPNLKLATIEQVGHNGIHDVARVMNDTLLSAIYTAIRDGRMQDDNDILIVRNDADVKHLNAKYIASYQKAMLDNPKTPLFTGTTWFNVDRQKVAPAFGSVLMIERMMNLVASLNGRIHTAGGNFAYRAAQFGAISAYGTEDDWKMAGADDLKVGFRVNNVLSRIPRSQFAGDNSLMNSDTKMLVRVGGATLDTDDARYLKFYANSGNFVINDAYRHTPGGYNSNPIRPEDIQNFTEKVNDRQSFNDIVQKFEREMTDFFSIDGGSSAMLEGALSWWFGGPVDGLYTVTPTNETRYGDRVYKFKLTEEGRQRYRESLINRVGDGTGIEDLNNLQRAISSGAWLTPVSNSQ